MIRTKRILFETLVAELGDEPLFKSAYDLARFIVSSHLLPGKNARTLGNFLVQVTRGERKLPTKQEAAILEAVRLRLDHTAVTKEQREEWTQQVLEALRNDAQERRTPVALDADDLYYELVNFSKSAANQFIVTERPAELVSSPRAQTLNEILFNRLGLEKFAKTGVAGTPGASYVFNFPSKSIGVLFWHSVEHTIEQIAAAAGKSVDPKALIATLQKLETAQHLVVHCVPAQLCVYPSVVFDPEAQSSTGFVFYYHGGDDESVSVAKMDAHSLQHWKESYFLSIHRSVKKQKNTEYEQVHVATALDSDEAGNTMT